MDMHLFRYNMSPKESEGVWVAGGLRLLTIEQPWNDNIPNISCVPEGKYKLVPHSGTRRDRTWALVNPTLGVYHLPDERNHTGQRFACLVHSANFASQLRGCIAPGNTGLEMYNSASFKTEPAVGQSGDAMEKLRELLVVGSLGHTLTIKNVGN